MRRGHVWSLALVAIGIVGSGCELAEVAAPTGEDVLVVEAVLRAGARTQYVILHRSIEGGVVRGEPDASVAVLTEEGRRIQYDAADLRNCLVSDPREWDLGEVTLSASCYVSPPDADRFVQPGREYRLEIETMGGEIARGRTRLPTAYGFHAPAVELDPATLVAECALPDTAFTMAWGRAEGAWSYVVAIRLEGWKEALGIPDVDATDPLELTSVSVSANDTTLLFPTNIGLFQRGEIDQRLFAAIAGGIPRGIETTLVVVAADRNYTNAIRGGRFNPSGNVRLSSVSGDAVGVFGGIVPLAIRPIARGEEPVPDCPMPPI